MVNPHYLGIWYWTEGWFLYDDWKLDEKLDEILIYQLGINIDKIK